jgi:hypothetical protein
VVAGEKGSKRRKSNMMRQSIGMGIWPSRVQFFQPLWGQLSWKILTRTMVNALKRGNMFRALGESLCMFLFDVIERLP